jgi:hypothetical protein
MLICLQLDSIERRGLRVIDVYDEGEKLADMVFREGLSIKHIRTLAQKAELRDPKLLRVIIKSLAHNRKWESRSIQRLLDILQRCESNTELFRRTMIVAVMVHPYVRMTRSRSWR